MTGDWRDEVQQYEDRSQMDDITDWNSVKRRSTSDEVVDKVVDYINNVQPFGSPRRSYRFVYRVSGSLEVLEMLVFFKACRECHKIDEKLSNCYGKILLRKCLLSALHIERLIVVI